MNLKLIFSLLFLNINISVTIHAIDLKFSVRGHKILLKERVSQIFVLGFSFDCMSKTR